MGGAKTFIKHRVGDWGWLGLITVPTAMLYFSNISRWSIWHDESFTAMLIDYDWSEILRRTALDVHPPLFYIFMKLWTGLFGTSLLAMRSFSALAMLGVIIASYFLVKSLLGKGTARLATIFLALAPFLLRYAQEARMYAIVALFLILAAYVLITAVKKQSSKLLYLYGLLVALAVYCHYYALFVVPAFWLYVLLLTRNQPLAKHHISLKNKHWWGSNFFILLLLAPWLPTAFRQFTSIQGAFWIPPVKFTTLLGTISNFLFYREYWMLDVWQKVWLWSVSSGLAVLAGASIYFNKLQRRGLVLIAAYTFLPPFIILLLSLPPFQPIYNNRYFSLTAPAFYILLAALVYLRPLNRFRLVQVAAVTLIMVNLIFGIYNVRQIGNFNPDRHEHYTMKELSQFINNNYQDGDAIVSTNLSTYFDIRYHNQTAAKVLLKVGEQPNGIGNTSLIYDRQDLLLYDYTAIKSSTNRVWLVTDARDTEPDVPDNWTRVNRAWEGYAAIAEYRIVATEEQTVCAQVITRARNVITGEIIEFPSSCLPEGWLSTE